MHRDLRAVFQQIGAVACRDDRIVVARIELARAQHKRFFGERAQGRRGRPAEPMSGRQHHDGGFVDEQIERKTVAVADRRPDEGDADLACPQPRHQERCVARRQTHDDIWVPYCRMIVGMSGWK
ncbi:MAG TPA: hypothetical protein VGI22_16740 [Xanthobacteraceae bacterium]